MTAEKTSDNVQEVMQSAIGRTRSYFESEFNISVTEVDTGVGNLDSLTLLDMTAIIGMVFIPETKDRDIYIADTAPRRNATPP